MISAVEAKTIGEEYKKLQNTFNHNIVISILQLKTIEGEIKKRAYYGGFEAFFPYILLEDTVTLLENLGYKVSFTEFTTHVSWENVKNSK